MKNLTAELLNGYVNGLESEAKKAVFEILDINEIEEFLIWLFCWC